ncbi:hypothetical protein [uncultured Maribacter sp.]|uniref:hypothetical protein n=1 Tax=uncultured Maribacter sp. TaxID=431308 RepID=UPI002612CCAD|nr:hypothetical protein [uncultured Maribacter sp.]
MDAKKVVIQVLVAMVLFVIISLIIEGDYSQEMIFYKGKIALLFGAFYSVYIVLRTKLKGGAK